MGISFDLKGAGELEKAIENAVKQFPYSTEKVLKSEAREIKKQITNSYVGDVLKSKHKGDKWKKALKKKNKTSLEKSFQPGKVIHSGSKYTTAVTSKAPHYHLVEGGHEASGWYKDKYSNADPIKGKKIVAKIMGRRSSKSAEIGQKVLDEILKDAGLE